jgi:hypothetical protein
MVADLVSTLVHMAIKGSNKYNTDRVCSCRQANQRNVVWVATESTNVGLDPFEHGDLISQA